MKMRSSNNPRGTVNLNKVIPATAMTQSYCKTKIGSLFSLHWEKKEVQLKYMDHHRDNHCTCQLKKKKKKKGSPAYSCRLRGGRYAEKLQSALVKRKAEQNWMGQ